MKEVHIKKVENRMLRVADLLSQPERLKRLLKRVDSELRGTDVNHSVDDLVRLIRVDLPELIEALRVTKTAVRDEMMVRPAPESHAQAYADALHEVLSALSLIKNKARWELRDGTDELNAVWVLDLCDGKVDAAKARLEERLREKRDE
jgi:hypothetical protein